MSHDNSPYNPNNERRKRIEKYHEIHEHNPKTGYMEKKKTVAKKMKSKLENKLDKFNKKNRGYDKNTKYLTDKF